MMREQRSTKWIFPLPAFTPTVRRDEAGYLLVSIWHTTGPIDEHLRIANRKERVEGFYANNLLIQKGYIEDGFVGLNVVAAHVVQQLHRLRHRAR